MTGVTTGQASLDDAKLKPAVHALADTFDKMKAGKPVFFSWQSLIQTPDARQLRRLILVTPKLDYSALEAGADASDAIRAWVESKGGTFPGEVLIAARHG